MEKETGKHYIIDCIEIVKNTGKKFEAEQAERQLNNLKRVSDDGETLKVDHLTSIDYSLPEFKWAVNSDEKDLQPIGSWRFETKNEALLAATLFLNYQPKKQAFEKDLNEFRFVFRMVLRMTKNYDSSWA